MSVQPLERLRDELVKIQVDGVMPEESIETLIGLASSLPLDHRCFVELYIRTKLPADNRLHQALEELGNPAIDPHQLAARLRASIENPLDLSADAIVVVGIELTWLEHQFACSAIDHRLVANRRIVLSALALLLAKASRGDRSASQELRRLFTISGKPRKCTQNLFQVVPWLEEKCAGYRPRIVLWTSVRRVALSPLRTLTAVVMLFVFLGLLALSHTYSGNQVAPSTKVDAPPATRPGMRTAIENFTTSIRMPEVIERLKPKPNEQVVVFLLTEKYAPEIEQALTQLPVALHVVAPKEMRVEIPVPQTLTWIDRPDFDSGLWSVKWPSGSRLLVIAVDEHRAAGRETSHIVVMDVALREIVFTCCGAATGEAPPRKQSREYVEIAKRYFGEGHGYNYRTDLFLRMASASATSEGDRAEVAYLGGKFRAKVGGPQNEQIACRLFLIAIPFLHDSEQIAYAEGFLEKKWGGDPYPSVTGESLPPVSHPTTGG
jgi:hypothetical protein